MSLCGPGTLASLGLTAFGLFAKGSLGAVAGDADAQADGGATLVYNETVVADPTVTSDLGYTGHVTVYDTTTVYSETTLHNTSTIWTSTTIPVTKYVDVTILSTETLSSAVTECTTTTYHYSESTTTTLHYSTATTETETDSTTLTNTEYATSTVFSYTYDGCPTTCSMSVETVNLYFWPTAVANKTEASTYYDAGLEYTFTYPSVYMYIPTAVGTDPANGATVGPATSSWMLPLRLPQVSTVDGGGATKPLTLADLGTDCAQTLAPSAVATLVDARCDPVLAAPQQVSSWAWPCNACGRFGLFDPPYALTTATGGLVTPTTTATASPVSQTVTTAGATGTTATTTTTTTTAAVAGSEGTLLIVYASDGTPMATATVRTTGVSGSTVSTVDVPSVSGGSGGCSPVTGTSSSATSSVVTGGAPEVDAGCGFLWAVASVFVVAFVF